MIGILLSSLLFIFGLICTFSRIPTTKKFLHVWFKYFLDQEKNPSQDDWLKKPTKSTADHEEKRLMKNSKSDLRSVFATFDKNNDGYITKEELKESLKNIGISAGEKDVSAMVEKVDSNGDGLIDFDEFCELFYSISSRNDEGHDKDGDLKDAFDVFDDNKDGLITVEELGLVLSSLGFTEGNMLEDCKEMIRRVDMDGDGMVNFDEFKTMMKNGIGRPVSHSS